MISSQASEWETTPLQGATRRFWRQTGTPSQRLSKSVKCKDNDPFVRQIFTFLSSRLFTYFILILGDGLDNGGTREDRMVAHWNQAVLSGERRIFIIFALLVWHLDSWLNTWVRCRRIVAPKTAHTATARKHTRPRHLEPELTVSESHLSERKRRLGRHHVSSLWRRAKH